MPAAVSAACKDPVTLWYVYNMVRVQYGTCTIWYVCNMVRVQYGTCTIWYVYNMVRVQYGTCAIWYVYNMERVQYGTCTIWYVYNMVRVQYGTCTIWSQVSIQIVALVFCLCPGTRLAMYPDDLHDRRMNLTSLKISTRWKRMLRWLW
jgi:hypothetical protein